MYICIYIYRKEDGKEDLDNLNNTSKLTINPLNIKPLTLN